MKRRKKMNDFNVLSPEIAYFLIVYEQRSINGAARKAGLDAGNISRTITRLEDTLGTKLFVRHKTGLNPTDTCERFYTAVIDAQVAFNKKISTNTRDSRRIKIGFYSTVAYAHFSNLFIQSLIDNNLEPEFVIAPSGQLVELLKKRELDFVLSHNPVKFPGLVARSLSSEGVVLCSKSGVDQNILLLHPDMLGLERIIQSLSYEKRWLLKDYFVIGKTLERNEHLMGLLPESLLLIHPGLKVIKSYPKEGKITALSWPGSVGLELMKCISK